MKINIGKYHNWIGPYQVMDVFKPIFGEDRIEKFTDSKFFDEWADKVMPFFNWIESKKKRKIRIRIDKFDTWGADHTLSLVIVPLLEKFKEGTQSSPTTDNSDVPEHLHSIMDEDGNDEFVHARWEWILTEIIWAFTEIRDDKWEEQYHSGVCDLQWKDVPQKEIDSLVKEDPDLLDAKEIAEGMKEMVEGPKHTRVFDKKGYIKHKNRIDNGTRLFGKYYSGLWS